MNGDQELLAIFRAEVDEQIDDLCSRLERRPSTWKIDRLFQIAHNVKGAARLVGADSVRDAAHALEDLFSAIRAGLEASDEVAGLARSGAELLDACFRAMDSGSTPDVATYASRIRTFLEASQTGPTAAGPRSTPDVPPEAPPPASDQPDQVEEQTPAEAVRSGDVIRVGTEKLDALMGIASDLVTQVFQSDGHAALAKQLVSLLALTTRHRPELRRDPQVRDVQRAARELARRLTEHSGDALRVSDELQGSLRSLRMVPFSGLKTVLSRTVREACSSEQRSATLRVSGAKTEVDRAVLEDLRDPLVHVLRNAVAHGIEPTAERVAAGKPEAGLIVLEARAVGPWVEIVVSDDGRGIDCARIRERALETGLATTAELDALADHEVSAFLFQPGFTTARAVSQTAGRGVGLDVVKSRMARLGGDVALSSQPGQGSRVTLRLPLTRLTTSGIVVRLADQTFAIPTTDVERTLQVKRDAVILANGLEVVEVEGRHVRLAHLASVLGYEAQRRDQSPAVVVSDGARRRAFLVDQVIGEREYVVQPLCWNLKAMPGVSGSAVVDGTEVVLVVDSHQLLGSRKTSARWSEKREQQSFQVLVVDDSVTSRTLERNILRTAGYLVETAVDGVEALRLLAGHAFDLVITDIEMPEMDGIELTRRIRGDKNLDHLPVVLVTSLESERDKQKGAEAGANAYIVKGEFDQDELLRTVARLM